MITTETLAGYILEELLAKLVQNAGYRLLTHDSQDLADLKTHPRTGDLQVKGRGALHQVDVLGEFTIIPAFSQPIRLFVEAKARKAKLGVAVVRNAVGTINDVNQAWMLDHSAKQPRRTYLYALFSTSGFSNPAQSYAIAHQISLVDLSGPEWDYLRSAAADTAQDLLLSAPVNIRSFPIRLFRDLLRADLGTERADKPEPASTEQTMAIPWLRQASLRLAAQLATETEGAVLLFPAGRQPLLANVSSMQRFIEYATRVPDHEVTVTPRRQRPGSTSRLWTISPVSGADIYRLEITLPTAVEDQALEEGERRRRSRVVTDVIGGQLDILWDPDLESNLPTGPRIFRLRFNTQNVRNRRLQLDEISE